MMWSDQEDRSHELVSGNLSGGTWEAHETGEIEVVQQSENPQKKRKWTGKHFEDSRMMPAAKMKRSMMELCDQDEEEERDQRFMMPASSTSTPSRTSAAADSAPPLRIFFYGHIQAFRTKKRSTTKTEPPSSIVSKSQENNETFPVHLLSSSPRRFIRRKRVMEDEQETDLTNSSIPKSSNSNERFVRDVKHNRLFQTSQGDQVVEKPRNSSEWFVHGANNPLFQTSQEDHVMEMVFYSKLPVSSKTRRKRTGNFVK